MPKRIQLKDKNKEDLFPTVMHPLGGELIAIATVINGSPNSSSASSETNVPFSSNLIPDKQFNITNYIDDIFEFNSGTILVKTKGIVGLVEAQLFISGHGEDSESRGIWFIGNENELPTGVNCFPNERNVLLGGNGIQYIGGGNTYFYTIDDNAPADTEFFVNPAFRVYNGSFSPATAGTKCMLLVKAYAKIDKKFIHN